MDTIDRRKVDSLRFISCLVSSMALQRSGSLPVVNSALLDANFNRSDRGPTIAPPLVRITRVSLISVSLRVTNDNVVISRAALHP